MIQVLQDLLLQQEPINTQSSFDKFVSIIIRARVVNITCSNVQTMPTIDGHGIYQFALSLLVVLYNVTANATHTKTIASPYACDEDIDQFESLCKDAKLCMQRIYANMEQGDNAPHFLCTQNEMALLLTTLRGLLWKPAPVTPPRESKDRQKSLTNLIQWMSESIDVYMSFESTLTVWILCSAKMLLSCVDLAMCPDDRSILAMVRSIKYQEEWDSMLAGMQSFAMVDCDKKLRAHALDSHNIDALLMTLLCKHSTDDTFWSKVVFWENDALPLWCAQPFTPHRRRKRFDPFHCVIIRRADHWVVQTHVTREIHATLAHGVVVWLNYIQQTSRRELTLAGVDEAVQDLASIIIV
jgi:hypothetical protein